MNFWEMLGRRGARERMTYLLATDTVLPDLDLAAGSQYVTHEDYDGRRRTDEHGKAKNVDELAHMRTRRLMSIMLTAAALDVEEARLPSSELHLQRCR